MVDYSKWKDIEISDDEDETHPNIDTPSLFRWRHQARVERMEERRREKENLENRKKDNFQKLSETRKKLAEAGSTDLTELKKAIAQLEKEEKEILKKEDELKKKEKQTPWNVDTISEPGFTKTVINTKAPRPREENLTEEQKEEKMKKFIKENEKLLKQFGMLRRYDDSQRFLQQHSHLVCEETANYLVIWCINLEMEGKHDLMSHVAHQTICMQYILELSKQLDVDPRACVGAFISRIQVSEKTYKDSFDDELEQFKERIKKRAHEKLQEAIREQEEEERKARLGPGGLDPVEVYEELPDELKKCFDAQDVPMLQATIAKMPEQEAIYYMKRCVDAGLWVPGKNDDEPTMMENAGAAATGAASNDPTPATNSTTDNVD
ncbi:hsp90 co-chaperone Cdc37 [Hyposmocoma kahamanoa]|uniref:hsp90 co-chaperone Cdc37 n=1 Tax=Hyposmocoma kahamanoa TaxID=1477025 RepID=UPI000E6D77C6|nr:hsp90 co-chaperone Cdc37 [Hyposmocoma kahamanoa]